MFEIAPDVIDADNGETVLTQINHALHPAAIKGAGPGSVFLLMLQR